MDDRSFYLWVGTLGAAVLGMLLDASVPSFNVDPAFYPFLGVFAGTVSGYNAVLKRRRKQRDEEDDR